MTDLGLLALRRHAERLLSPWDSRESPGATLGLVRDGALALHASAGMASLELGVPIGPDTRFRIASVSKQFTCAAILMLAEEGLLAPHDPLLDHLPDLPDAFAPITLDHLMRNSSGLRDMLELMRAGGADLAQPCEAEALLAAVHRQRGLNFPPGTQFLYSNTGFMLLGRVVERVAGEPLGVLLDRRILAPLGMTRTRHTPAVTEVVPGLATGYLPRGRGHARAQHGFPLGGEGGLVSCVEDLALWDAALATGRVIGRGVAEALAAQAPFENGMMNSYARGLEVARHRGLRTLDHGGLWPGFRTCFLRVPDRGLTVIAIANHGGVDAHLLAHRMLDAAIEGQPGVHPAPPLPPREELAPLVGRWIAEDGATTVEFALDPTGAPQAVQHGVPFALVPGEHDRLVARRGAFAFSLALPPEGADALWVETSAGQATRFLRAPERADAPLEIAGRWWCEELEAAWTFTEEDGALAVLVRGPIASGGPWAVTPIAPDAIRVATPGTLAPGWFDVALLRDAAGTVAALSVSGARAIDLRFVPAPGGEAPGAA
ncbi:MAG: beta-lactamase family protein [Acetobacteraceae bacterium]|nr:beta-lactamase family protein [Acetobacteraceae bacterium]